MPRSLKTAELTPVLDLRHEWAINGPLHVSLRVFQFETTVVRQRPTRQCRSTILKIVSS